MECKKEGSRARISGLPEELLNKLSEALESEFENVEAKVFQKPEPHIKLVPTGDTHLTNILVYDYYVRGWMKGRGWRKE